MEKNIFDVIIIGAGPGGLNAALYAARANLDVLFIEKGAPGGKMTTTFNVSNWIGTEEIRGAELSLKMFNHAKKSGAKYKFGTVEKINDISHFEKEIILSNGEKLYSKTVVIASGMKNRVPMEIEGIRDYENKGVSYCSICDGPLYGNVPQAIIGGGNSAIEEGIYLSSIAEKVYIFVKDKKLNAESSIVDSLKKRNNIEVFFESQVKKIIGNEKGIEKILVDVKGENKEFYVSSLFPYIGFIPVVDFASHLDIFDNSGFIITDKNMETKIKGIFAIGDIRTKEIRQIITAASDGAIVGKFLANEITK
ncbi:MAG: NAD(P)/FAD-dependent oxidoreductase [Metamycoplasmataceae bacterium]